MVPLKVTVPVPALIVPLLTQGPAMVSPKVVVVRVPLIVICAQVAAAVIVTVIPLLIITTSVTVGTAEPPQVAVALQAPVTDAVFVALKAIALNAITSNIMMRIRVILFILLSWRIITV
jgi:hypothetical protein